MIRGSKKPKAWINYRSIFNIASDDCQIPLSDTKQLLVRSWGFFSQMLLQTFDGLELSIVANVDIAIELSKFGIRQQCGGADHWRYGYWEAIDWFHRLVEDQSIGINTIGTEAFMDICSVLTAFQWKKCIRSSSSNAIFVSDEMILYYGYDEVGNRRSPFFDHDLHCGEGDTASRFWFLWRNLQCSEVVGFGHKLQWGVQIVVNTSLRRSDYRWWGSGGRAESITQAQ